MKKKNIARAGAAFVLLLGLTVSTIFCKGTEATSKAENSRKVAAVTETEDIKKSNSKNTEKNSEKKQSDEATSKTKTEQEKQSENTSDQQETAKATATENKSESNSARDDSNSENENQSKTEKPNGGSSGSTKPSHKHTWTPQKTTINHPATGHNEQVLVKDAWTEKIPIYENDERSICNACGADITGNEVAHVKNHMLNGENGGFHSKWESVLTGYNEVYHEAEYTTKWVEDSPAWSEEVVTGYTCSCGATK